MSDVREQRLAELKAMGQEYTRAYCSVPFPAKDIPHLIRAFRSKERRTRRLAPAGTG
jgi:hypothetical protein